MEESIRLAAFEWLKEQTALHGETLPRTLLERGFSFQGEHVTLVGASGIWKPRQFEIVPISITSTVKGPYDDAFSDDGLLIYRYRGTDPGHRDNRGLAEAMRTRTPLIYFYGVVPGRYLPVWPVFVVRNDPGRLQCMVAVDPGYALADQSSAGTSMYDHDDDDSSLSVRRYVTAFTRRRLHQLSFRERVIAAYDEHCTICALHHRELLDAAHIVPDNQERGDPVVPNGLSLCKIHHAAYDGNILGITPDYEVRIRGDILEEIDGPMLRYGLQELHKKSILLPRSKKNLPDRERLELRYQQFRRASA